MALSKTLADRIKAIKGKTLEKARVNSLVDALDNKVVEVEVEKLAKTLPSWRPKSGSTHCVRK